jgi:hypothetical protein
MLHGPVLVLTILYVVLHRWLCHTAGPTEMESPYHGWLCDIDADVGTRSNVLLLCPVITLLSCVAPAPGSDAYRAANKDSILVLILRDPWLLPLENQYTPLINVG